MNKYIKAYIAGFLFLGMVVPAGADDMVKVRGSDVMVNLVQRLAEVYMEKNPGKYVSVTGGGSGNGISGLRNRTTDIANSSREVRKREIIDMKGKGVNPSGIILAEDCITIVVNETNKVDKMTIETLGAVFRGDVTNWKDLGGEDVPITLYGRQSNSGTYLVFRERVLKGDYSFGMNRMNGNSQIVEAIKADGSGIGFIGLAYAENTPELRVVSISRRQGEEFIDPKNRQDVEDGKYPLIRPIYQYFDSNPSEAIMDFLKFGLGSEGQQIIEEMKFIPLSEKYAVQNKQSLGR